jgi:carbon-monoxide dehydrogenase medium subunit
MIPRFSFERPTTLDGALEAQAKDPDYSAYLAGGTELLQVMKMGLTQVDHVIDLKGLPGLRQIRTATDGGLEIGSLVTHREIERSSEVAARLPELVALEHRVANPRVRATGTIGGNLAFAEPHSDPATFLLACGALIDLIGADGPRTVPIAQFFSGPLATVRRPNEILRAIRITPAGPDQRRAYEKFALFERPSASAAVTMTVSDGRIVQATVVVGSVTDAPTILISTGMALAGTALSDVDDVMRAIRRDPPDEISVYGDYSGSADYKLHIAWEMVARAASRASRNVVP